MKTILALPLILFTILFTSCTAIKTAPYDQYSYQKAVEIKVDASRLIDQSVNPYIDYSEDINTLLVDIEKIILYEENKPSNSISYRMWALLGNEKKNLLAGYLKKWENEGKLSNVFVNQAKSQIEEAMDMLIQYEGKKDKVSKAKLMDIITSN